MKKKVKEEEEMKTWNEEVKKDQNKINEWKDEAQNTGWDGEQQLEEEQQQRDEGSEMKKKQDELTLRRLIICRRN